MELEVKKMLPIKLDKETLIDRAKQLTSMMGLQAEKMNELKATTKMFKDGIAKIEQEVWRLRFIVASGHEDQMIECAWKFDFFKNTKTLIRMDSGEIVEECPMTDAERQLALDVKTEPFDSVEQHAYPQEPEQ